MVCIPFSITVNLRGVEGGGVEVTLEGSTVAAYGNTHIAVGLMFG